MHIKQGFLLKKIGDEYAAIPYDEAYTERGAMVSLNDSGAYLWKCLEEECTQEELTLALKEEYGLDEAMANEAVTVFLSMLREQLLLEE